MKVVTLLLASVVSPNVKAFTFTTFPAQSWNKKLSTRLDMNRQENDVFVDHANSIYKAAATAAVSLAIIMNPTPALADGELIYMNNFLC